MQNRHVGTRPIITRRRTLIAFSLQLHKQRAHGILMVITMYAAFY
jgi:hypothetical protein